MRRTCKLCQGPVVGRSDKIFCSIPCKNEYHIRLRRATARAVRSTDKILHRNRSILLEIMGKKARQKKVHRQLLDQKKFNYHFYTGTYPSAPGLCYFRVYDFLWKELPAGTIHILRV